MKKINTLIIILLFCNYLAVAQNYFQQEVNYTIQVKLDDKTHELSAFEEIEYINNSPNTLNFIYFHLWPNAYKNNSTALAKQKQQYTYYDIEKYSHMQGYIDSLDFKINGEPAKWELDENHIDICKLYLNKPLKPNEKITITTPFHVKIPSSRISRLGHHKQSYQITQWYPKPAVYDSKGWHQMPYLNTGEFYSEFGSFDVSITLPKNYVVGATGDLQNKEEIEWLNQLAEKTAGIKDFDKTDHSFPESSTELKTLQYTQKNVHDFAWFADKRYHVLKGEREMPNTKKTVTCWAMFLNKEADLWQRSIEYIGDALYYYSLWYGDYPYNQCTAVHSSISAGSGMEYPNITVIGDSRKPMLLEMVIMHEVGHNWFYGILGFNEREHPWLDEGINSFSEARYMKEKYNGEDKLYKLGLSEKQAKFLHLDNLSYHTFPYFSYLITARFNIDQPASLASEEYTASNYGQIIYHKTSCVFTYLHNYLGEDTFNHIMQDFYEEWKFKHPYPEDIRAAFESATNKDLDWIFDDLLQTTKKLDYKITKLEDNKVTIANKGMINAPCPISGIKDNQVVFTQWHDGFNDKKSFEIPSGQSYDCIAIDAQESMPEIYRGNNYIKTKGLLKKVEPLQVQFYGIAENPKRTTLNLSPAMGYNLYNEYMLGLVFYNSFIPRNKFEYQIAPMYGFGNKNLSGSARIAYHILPYESLFREVTLELSGKRFAFSHASDDNFHKLKADIGFDFKKSDPLNTYRHSVHLNYIIADDMNDIFTEVNPELESFINLNYKYNNSRLSSPHSIKVGAQYHKDFTKLNGEFNYKYKYHRQKAIDIRLFAGTFITKSDDYSPLYNFNLSGASGINDYTYDDMYFGRFEDPAGEQFFSKQYYINDGGFTTYAPQFTTPEWLLALNVSAAIPGLPRILNFHVYGNIATYGSCDSYLAYDNSDKLSWEAGVQYRIGGNTIIISLPVVMSKQLNDFTSEVHSNVAERIRFSFNIDNLNPFKTFESQMVQ